MTTKTRVEMFMNCLDKAENYIAEAKKIAWDEIRAHAGNITIEQAPEGWAMHDIADHMLWWLCNSNDYAEEIETLNKCLEK